MKSTEHSDEKKIGGKQNNGREEQVVYAGPAGNFPVRSVAIPTPTGGQASGQAESATSEGGAIDSRPAVSASEAETVSQQAPSCAAESAPQLEACGPPSTAAVDEGVQGAILAGSDSASAGIGPLPTSAEAGSSTAVDDTAAQSPLAFSMPLLSASTIPAIESTVPSATATPDPAALASSESLPDGKVVVPKEATPAAKERSSYESRGKLKSSGVVPDAADSQCKVAGVKSPDVAVSSDHGGGAGQPGASDSFAQHIVVGAFTAQPTVAAEAYTAGTAGATSSADGNQTLPGFTPASSTTAMDAPVASALSNARLIQSMHQSEMRLGMNSAEFGSISINTSLTSRSITAQISLDHSALSQALAMHLPAIQERLGSAYGLEATVEMRSSSNGSAQGGAPQHSHDSSSGSQHGSWTAATSSPVARSSFTTPHPVVSVGATRLDIRI